jgi:hypothetical protein
VKVKCHVHACPRRVGQEKPEWQAELGENMPCSVPATRWKDDYMGASLVWEMRLLKKTAAYDSGG